jgi:hypothetical protein
MGGAKRTIIDHMTLVEQVKSIYRLLADDRIEKLGLLRVGEGIAISLADDALSLFTYRSKRTDEFVEQPVIEGLIGAVKASKGLRGINHIGFCYKVASKESEVKRIVRAASNKGYPAYREPSSDDAAWVFVGDMSEITNPLLEFLPHEGQVNDRWIDYWLPHIQFDIDTGLSPDEIKVLVKKFIRRPFTPYSIQIDGVTYIQRVNLGCIEGVNLVLDLSTNNRDINHRRSWDKLT